MFHQPIRSPHNTNIMYNNPIMQLRLSNSYNTTTYHSHRNLIYQSWHHPSTHVVKHLDQIGNHTSMHHSTIVPNSPHSLAQANRSRSGKGGPLAQAKSFSPKRDRERGKRTLRGLAQASPLLPRRDHSSLKNKNLSSKREIEQQVLGEPLLISPRRGKLAWARKPVPAIVLSSDSHPYAPTQSNIQFQPIKFTHRPFNHHRLIKQADSTENVVRSSFPYLE